MNKLKLSAQIVNLRGKANSMLNKAELEKRELTEDEQKVFEEALAKIDELEEEVKSLREETSPEEEEKKEECSCTEEPKEEDRASEEEEPKEEEPEETPAPEEEEKEEVKPEEETETKNTRRNMNKNFNLVNAINAVLNHRDFDSAEAEIIEAGAAQFLNAGQSVTGQIQLRSDLVAGTQYAGQEFVPEEKAKIEGALRAKSVAVAAGAKWLTGLVGDLSIPVYSGSNVAWATETGAATDGAGTTSEVILKPKRVTAYVAVSKTLLAQTSEDVQTMLINDLTTAIAEKVESTIFGTAAGSGTQPAGLLNGVTQDSAAATFADIIGMEAALEANNVYGDYTYILSPAAKSAFRTTTKDTGSGQFIMQNGEIEGNKVLSSGVVATKGVLVGDFTNLVIGQWGGIDILVDPYTEAKNNKVVLVASAFVDAAVTRANAIQKRILV